MRLVGWITAALLTGLLLLPQAAGAQQLNRGFVDDVWFDPPSYGISIPQWISKTKATGARFVAIEVDWGGVEPNAPVSGENTTSPSDPNYDFTSLDKEVRTFRGSGLTPVFLVTYAPRWAEGSGGTAAEYTDHSYRPNAVALGHFAQALAARYSGSYPDPLNPGKALPRVHYLQAWAEAAFNIHLSPQWTKVNGRWVNTAAYVYRSMLNHFYTGVKKGSPSSLVISSGLASYGDAPGGVRTHPIVFLRNMFCLNSKLHRKCGAKTHFDILAADPYEVGSPTQHAFSKLDASAPDLGRMMHVVNAGIHAGTVLPSHSKALWVTEFGYDSNPPNPAAVSLSTQARWLQLGFYVFWNEHVQTVMWYLVRDQAPPYTVNYASGVYFRGGRKKPSFTAYHFPFVVRTVNRRRERIWGISPRHGTVTVQRKVHRRWRRVARFRRGPGMVFTKRIRRHRGLYRAVIHGQHSLVWRYG